MKEVIQYLLARFARPGFGAEVRPPATELSLQQLKLEADAARQVLESDAYVAAYQRALDKILTELLSLDVSQPDKAERALRLVAQAQQHQQIAHELAGAMNRYAYEERRRAAEKQRRAA